MDDYDYIMECGFSYEEAQHLTGDYDDYEEDQEPELTQDEWEQIRKAKEQLGL